MKEFGLPVHKGELRSPHPHPLLFLNTCIISTCYLKYFHAFPIPFYILLHSTAFPPLFNSPYILLSFTLPTANFLSTYTFISSLPPSTTFPLSFHHLPLLHFPHATKATAGGGVPGSWAATPEGREVNNRAGSQ